MYVYIYVYTNIQVLEQQLGSLHVISSSLFLTLQQAQQAEASVQHTCCVLSAWGSSEPEFMPQQNLVAWDVAVSCCMCLLFHWPHVLLS